MMKTSIRVMAMVWACVGSVPLAAGAAKLYPGFECKFINAAGKPSVVSVQTGDRSAAEIIIGTDLLDEQKAEPTPAQYTLRNGVISIYADIAVLKHADGSPPRLGEKQYALAFQLRWIPGVDSKKWLLISKDPLIKNLPTPPLCDER